MPPEAGPSLDERFHALAFRFRLLRETRFGSFVPVLAALAVIWAARRGPRPAST